jgi:CDP-2,3-bis-(O-geranylgeranyl)-sn-glycerol synthase
MHPLFIAQLLTLLAVANGTPVIAARIFEKALAFPLDGNATFPDGRPLFGASKTLRGVVLSIVVTSAIAPLVGMRWWVGTLVAIMAMLGDLFSSFVKRRLGLAPSDKALGLDQIPESLLPLLACAFVLPLTILDVFIATLMFFVGALIFSPLLFKLGIRDRPH